MPNNFVKWIDVMLWRPFAASSNTTHAAGISWCGDKRSDTSRHPFLFQLASNTVINRHNMVTKSWVQSANPWLGGTFGAGATCEFAPSRALEGNIGAWCTNTKIVTTTAMTAVGVNMLANRGWSGDYWFKIRIIGKTAGKVEERFIVANTGGTTPTLWLDKPLTFVPTATDTYEILWGAVYMLGAGAIVATSFRWMEVAANGIASLSSTGLPTIATDSYLTALDEQYTPYDMNPWEGLVKWQFLYDTGTVSTRYALTASASGASSLTGQVAIATVTISNADPCVITHTGHPFVDGSQIIFTTTGSLPTGLNASQTYYVKKIDANSYKVSADRDLVQFVATTSAGSGTHSVFAGDSLIGLNEYRNFQIRIVQDTVNPTAVNQRRIIASHTAWPTPVYTLGSAWTVTPSASAKFVIELPNLLVMRSSGQAFLYVYNYNKETINNGTGTIAANAWSSTYFASPTQAGWAWYVLFPSFGIQPDVGRNARHSFLYNFRAWGNSNIDLFDMSGAATWSWSNGIVYDGQSQSVTTWSCWDYSPFDNEGRFGYLNIYASWTNNQIYRFDVQNRVLSPYTPTSWIQSGTAAVGNRMATFCSINGNDKYTNVFLQAHLSPNIFELITQV